MKKTSTLILLIALIQISSLRAQFSKVYYQTANSLTANAMARTLDGGLMICVSHNSSSMLMKVDSGGTVLWAKDVGSNQNDAFSAIAETSDSCFVIAGKIYDVNSVTIDLFVAKIDQAGNFIWAKSIPGGDNQEALSVQQTSDGGYILAGQALYLTAPFSEIIVVKLDPNGDVDWYKMIEGGNNSNYAQSVKETPDGGFVLTGYVEDYPPFDANGYLCKLSSTGAIEWTNKYNTNTPQAFFGSDLLVMSDGIISYYNCMTEHAIVKTDFLGNDIWRKSIGALAPGTTCANCIGSKLKLLSDGNIAFVTGSNQYFSQSALINIDTTGNFNWAQYLFNSVHDVLENDERELYLLGNGPLIGVRTTSVTEPQIGLTKTDSLGNESTCNTPVPTVSVILGNISSTPATFIATSVSETSVLLTPSATAFSITEISGCVDVIGGVEESDIHSISIFPNPSANQFEISPANIKGSNLHIEICDITGRVVYSKEITSDCSSIGVDHTLNSGLYTVVVNDKTSKYIAKLIVK